MSSRSEVPAGGRVRAPGGLKGGKVGGGGDEPPLPLLPPTGGNSGACAAAVKATRKTVIPARASRASIGISIPHRASATRGSGCRRVLVLGPFGGPTRA